MTSGHFRIAPLIVAMLVLAVIVGCGSGSLPEHIAPRSSPAPPTLGASPAIVPVVTSPAPFATFPTSPTASSVPAISAEPTPTSTVARTLSVAEINKKARPAIVQITNNQKVRGRQGTSSYEIPAGAGTGFVFDARGYILTNNHVVEGATSLTVATSDNQTYSGTVVGTFPDGDLAVVQIRGNSEFSTVELGDSSTLQVGDPVVAIGNALTLAGGPTVTTGVVSALGRVVQEPSDGTQPGAFLADLIQTDAAINPGNSGGPLLNSRGQVVGINTLGVSQGTSGVVTQGINFAISINSAKPVAAALISNAPVPRPYIGLNADSLSPLQDAQLHLPANTGVTIVGIQPGSPAARAGLKVGDIIIAFDGQAVQGVEGFAGFLLAHKPGETVTLIVLRSGQQQTIPVTFAQTPSA